MKKPPSDLFVLQHPFFNCPIYTSEADMSRVEKLLGRELHDLRSMGGPCIAHGPGLPAQGLDVDFEEGIRFVATGYLPFAARLPQEPKQLSPQTELAMAKALQGIKDPVLNLLQKILNPTDDLFGPVPDKNSFFGPPDLSSIFGKGAFEGPPDHPHDRITHGPRDSSNDFVLPSGDVVIVHGNPPPEVLAKMKKMLSAPAFTKAIAEGKSPQEAIAALPEALPEDITADPTDLN